MYHISVYFFSSNLFSVTDCFNYDGTLLSESEPKCLFHKGECIGFVVAEYSDPDNTDEMVILHILASFSYESEEKKEERAKSALKAKLKSGGTTATVWGKYNGIRSALKKAPIAQEVRREYRETEEGATKLYAV